MAGPFPWETFTHCVLSAVLRFGNGTCGACLGTLLVVMFPSSVLNILPFFLGGKGFYGWQDQTHWTYHWFPYVFFSQSCGKWFCEIFLSMFLPYFLTVKFTLTGRLEELGAWVNWIFRVTTKIIFVSSLVVNIFPKMYVFTFLPCKQNVANKVESLWHFMVLTFR